MRRAISLLLSILMVISLCPVSAFADDGTETRTETDGVEETTQQVVQPAATDNAEEVSDADPNASAVSDADPDAYGESDAVPDASAESDAVPDASAESDAVAEPATVVIRVPGPDEVSAEATDGAEDSETTEGAEQTEGVEDGEEATEGAEDSENIDGAEQTEGAEDGEEATMGAEDSEHTDEEDEEESELGKHEAAFSQEYTGAYLSAVASGTYNDTHDVPSISAIGAVNAGSLTVLETVAVNGLDNHTEITLSVVLRTLPALSEGESLVFYSLVDNSLSDAPIKVDLSQGSQVNLSVNAEGTIGVALVLVSAAEQTEEDADPETPAEPITLSYTFTSEADYIRLAGFLRDAGYETSGVARMSVDLPDLVIVEASDPGEFVLRPQAGVRFDTVVITFTTDEGVEGTLTLSFPEPAESVEPVDPAEPGEAMDNGETDSELNGVKPGMGGPIKAPAVSYYLVGTMNNWTISGDYKLSANVDTEYMITVSLPANTQLKVKGSNDVWYPGEGSNLTINDAGSYTIYFRPDGQGGDDWYYGVLYAAHNESWTVTFVADDETLETRSVAKGSAIGEFPAAPAKEGYRFDKWVSNNEAVDADTVPTGDMTVTASYVKVWTVKFYDRDANLLETRTVDDGTEITLPSTDLIPRDGYTAYWAYGTVTGEGQQTWTASERITTTTIPVNDDLTIGPDYDKITYTVTFYADETCTGEPIATRTVTADSNYCVNDMPAVPAQSGSLGKWVYSGGDFTNQVAVSADTNVWPAYDQNVFTVVFKVEGNSYKTEKYNKNDELVLPAEPVVEGKEFVRWLYNDQPISAGTPVTSDMEIIAEFRDEFYVRFVILDDDGVTVIETLSQYFRTEGDPIGTMPQDPFIEGKIFEKWVDQETGADVTAATVVNGNIVAVAQFRTVDVYNITVEYYYIGNNGEVIFSTELLQVEHSELPYTITAPSTTKTDPNEVTGAPIYYPETPTVEVKETDFDNDKHCLVRVKYVPYTAVYDFVYMLKDLTGDGYTEIDRESYVEGVLNSYVTPTVKTFTYATLERAEGATIETSGINGQPKQELKVYYTRKSFQLTYESNGGSYVGGVTVPYGTEQAVTETVPTRDGYTFAGWYTDEALTTAAGSTVTVNGNTTLYAKWTGDTVDYTIVYMFEKYNDTGTESSYVYDNSRNATGTVGTTVQASSAPTITRAGWEVDTAKNATSSVEIAADGSSVLNVYYKLVEYTFQFNAGTFGRYNVNATLTGKNVSGTGLLNYSFTAKIGQNITNLWPSAGTGTYYYDYYDVTLAGWRKPTDTTVYQDLKQYRLTTGLLPESGTTITYTGVWTDGDTTYRINIYLQNADDDGYTLSEIYSQSFVADGWSGRQWATTYSHDPINGYIYNESLSTPDGTWEYTGNHKNPYMNLYYDRYQYVIDYYYLSRDLNNSKTVRFGANINTATYDWTPTAAQCGVDDDYTFDGWYSDSGLTAKYTFATMPASNLVLYAKWTAPSFTVSFVDGEATSTNLFADQTVEKYKKATNPGTPTKAGYVFDGWYTAADGNDLFDFGMQITANTTVYAHWTRATLSYVVHYVDEDGNPVAPDKEVSNPNFTVGQSITESAIAVAGYRPETDTQTIELAVEGNEITFVYRVKGDKTSYKVRYIIDPEEYAGDIPVAEEKTVNDVPGDTASVIELAKAVDYTTLYAAHPELDGIEFFPDASEKTFVLTAIEENNVYTFIYSSYKNALVTVNFVDMDGNPIPGITADVQHLKVGKTFTLARTPIAGWELNKAVEGIAYGGTAAGTDYKITDAVAEGDGLVFTLFYQKKLTITVEPRSKQYDGTALTLPESLADQVTVEGLLDGHSLNSIQYTYTEADSNDSKGRLNAGVATVTPHDAVITGATENYYTVRYISGTLEVTKINVNVRIEPDRWTGNVYDGTVRKTGFTNTGKGIEDYVAISHDGYKAQYLNTIWAAVNSAHVSGETNYSQVTHDDSAVGLGYVAIAYADAGDYTYYIDFTLADLPQNDNYSVSLFVRSGRLEIKPKPVTVTTASDTKAYDGTPLTNSEATIEGLVDGETATATANGTITDPGSTENTYTIEWDTAKASNYTITDNLGTLTVTGATIKITAKDASKVYNGSAQNGYGFTDPIIGTGDTIDTDEYTIEGLAAGDVLIITDYVSATGTNVATYENGSFEHADITITRDGEDITAEFYTTITPIAGKLTITKAPLTITADSTSKPYDGTALTDDGWQDTAPVGLQGTDTVDNVTVTGSQTEVGSSANTPSVAVIKNGDGVDVTANYNITYTPGTLTVTDENIDPSLIVTKNDGKADDATYAEGETVTFTITVKNIYAEAKTITLTEITGVTLADTTFTDVPAGETRTTTATYVITPADMAAGSFTNTVTAKLEGKNYTASDTVHTEEIAAALTVTKSADPTSGVGVGETVTYTVVVTNSGNVTVR